jgi:hypothetical protein
VQKNRDDWYDLYMRGGRSIPVQIIDDFVYDEVHEKLLVVDDHGRLWIATDDYLCAKNQELLVSWVHYEPFKR